MYGGFDMEIDVGFGFGVCQSQTNDIRDDFLSFVWVNAPTPSPTTPQT